MRIPNYAKTRKYPRIVHPFKAAIKHPIRFIEATSWELRYKNPIRVGRCSICGLSIIEEHPGISKVEWLSDYDYDKELKKSFKKYLVNGKLICKKCQRGVKK